MEILLLMLSLSLVGLCIFLDTSMAFGFWISTFVMILYFKPKNKGIELEVKKTVLSCKKLYILIILIGANISVWMSSGVVPSLMYYGFEYMKGMNFLLAAFFIVSLFSVFMGTAVGTIGTVGIAIMGIGEGFSIDRGLLMGVIVSGAFIADKISPISGLLNLTISSIESNYKSLLKSMLKTFVPVILICTLIYGVLGYGATQEGKISKIYELQQLLKFQYVISIYIMIIPIMVVIMSLLGFDSLKSVFIGFVCGVFVSLFVQKVEMLTLIKYIFLGYENTGVEGLELLKSGGIKSMIEVIFIVSGAVALEAVFEVAGTIEKIIDKFLGEELSRYKLKLKTALMSMILTVFTCDQTVGIVLPAKALKKRYDSVKISREDLGRVISDSGTIIAPLMPWNVNAIIIFAATGVAATEYAKYAVLCFIFPIYSMIMERFD